MVTDARRPGGTAADGVTLLTLWVVLLLGIPSNFVLGPLGAVGSPAQLLGLGMLGWWLARRLARSFHAAPVAQPVRRAVVLLLIAVLASYVAAMMRPIDPVEASAANRGLLALCSWLGVFLVANDEIATRARLETLVRRLVIGVGCVAALGIVQFQTGMSFTNYLLLPGLTENSDAAGVVGRSGFARPSGTALHPIEFSVVVSMLLPLALHFALTDRSGSAFRRWFPVAAIGLVIPLSVSRSAILCTAAAMLIMLPVLSSRVRRAVGAASVVLIGAVYVMVPGMLGTIVSLFTGISGDNSAASRTDSYGLAGQFIANSPIFGRGFFTFLPEYRILDNQYLGALIEMGLFGLACLLGLFITGIVTAWMARRRSRDAETRQLTQALLASLAAGAVSFAFFDAFAFPQTAGIVFLMLGIIGAQYRLVGRVAVLPGRQARAIV